MTLTLPPSLFLKSLVVGSPLEDAANKLRWLLGFTKRHRHPELWELYLEERWLPLILQRLLVSESCGIDVGCHIGSFLSLLKRYAPNGRHVAFEASVTKSRWLKKRFPDVKIFPYAVANEAGRAFFEENYALPAYSHLQQDENKLAGNCSTYEVQVCCLDDVLLDNGKIDLIKLDIEGGELAALRGAYKLINKWHPAIIFECGSEYGSGQHKLTRKNLYDFITGDLNYKIFCFADFVFDKEEMTFYEFRKCGLYPFRAFNFVAIPRPSMNLSAT